MKDIKKEIQEELENLAPSLAKMRKEETIEVPQNYFNKLPDQILSQLDFPKNNTPTENIIATSSVSWIDQMIGSIGALFQPRIAIGFGMAIILMGAFLFLNKDMTVRDSGIVTLSDEELESYIKTNLDEYEEETLFSVFGNEEISDLTETEFEEEELENYMEEIIDEMEEEDLNEFL